MILDKVEASDTGRHRTEYDEVEVLILLDTIEALETFQQEHATIDALLEDEEVEHIHAYGLANDTVVELPLDGALQTATCLSFALEQ